MSFQKLLGHLDESRFDATGFESRIKVNFTDDTQDISASGRIKILKDSIIWGSINILGIPVIKIMITPGNIRYYNKLDKTYYDGDFSFISNQLGADLNFNNIQNLLLGNPIQSINASENKLKVRKPYYLITATEPLPVSSIKIYPFFKVLMETIKHNSNTVKVHYVDYQRLDKVNIPKKISISSQKETHSISIDLEYIRPVINNNMRFPFKIPSGYTAVYSD